MKSLTMLQQLNHIRRLTQLMDTAFKVPGLSLKVGLDPIIGLIPGVGDVVTTGISAYIIFLATRFGLPKGVIGSMVANVALEFLVGTVPFLGDIFDAFFKSNVRNLALLEEHLAAMSPELQSQDEQNLESAISEQFSTV